MIKKILKIYLKFATLAFLLLSSAIMANPPKKASHSSLISNPFQVKEKNVLTFKEQLKKASPGDYILTLKNDTYTLLIVNHLKKDPNAQISTLALEEVVLPKSALPKLEVSAASKLSSSLRKLAGQNYPEALVWNLYEIDFKSNRLIKAYSFKQRASLNLSDDHFLMKLLTLPLSPLNEDQRKKIGAPPQSGETDRRKLWQPIKFFEGQKIVEAQFNAVAALWPKDGTELSNKKIELYFDQDGFPFPYFIQIHSAQISVFLKVIDSGKNFPTMPYSFAH